MNIVADPKSIIEADSSLRIDLAPIAASTFLISTGAGDVDSADNQGPTHEELIEMAREYPALSDTEIDELWELTSRFDETRARAEADPDF